MSQSIIALNQGTPNGAVQIPGYDPAAGEDRRYSLSDILALVSQTTGTFTTVYAAPNMAGYVIDLPTLMTNLGIPAGTNLWLLITPIADYTTLTVNLPSLVGGQEILVSSTHAVSSALTVVGFTVGSPQPVNGAPATLTANGKFRLKADAVSGSWYAI